jgi:hypothetical protein
MLGHRWCSVIGHATLVDQGIKIVKKIEISHVTYG